jgi:DNA-binding NarL/FixJ family response regulator
MSKIKVAVVDDHALFRRGLVSLLSGMDEFAICGEAGNGEEALHMIESANPDIVLMDVNMPVMDGVQALEAVRKNRGDQKVLMLTISQSDEDLVRAIIAGANGYLLKNAEPETLRNTILEVMQGHSMLAPEMTEKVFSTLRRARMGQGQTLLSDREVEVLHFMEKGLTTHQMAESLYISDNTVKTHIRHILEKLEVNNRAQAVDKARDLGILA